MLQAMNNQDPNISEAGRSCGLYSLSSTLLPFAKQLLGKKGFVEVDILTEWDKIVGTELAQYSFPQRIDFKKGTKNNGTLCLSVPSGAFALELQHRERFILDKINTYFGYNAVSSLKIIQTQQFVLQPEKTQPPSPNANLTPEEEKYIENLTEAIDNPKLKTIITKLGKDIFKDNKNNKK